MWCMRVQWHRAPGSSVRSSPAARPRRFSRPFRESRGTLADRDSLLVPLCLPIARQSAAHYVENRANSNFSSTPRLIRVCAEEHVLSRLWISWWGRDIEVEVIDRFFEIDREEDFFFFFLFFLLVFDEIWKIPRVVVFGIVFFFFSFCGNDLEWIQQDEIVSFILSVEEFWIWKNRGEWMVWLWWLGVFGFEWDFCFFFFNNLRCLR